MPCLRASVVSKVGIWVLNCLHCHQPRHLHVLSEGLNIFVFSLQIFDWNDHEILLHLLSVDCRDCWVFWVCATLDQLWWSRAIPWPDYRSPHCCSDNITVRRTALTTSVLHSSGFGIFRVNVRETAICFSPWRLRHAANRDGGPLWSVELASLDLLLRSFRDDMVSSSKHHRHELLLYWITTIIESQEGQQLTFCNIRPLNLRVPIRTTLVPRSESLQLRGLLHQYGA